MPDNPPAFPYEHGHSPDARNVRESGISTRDYFAAKALTGLLASRIESGGPDDEIEQEPVLFILREDGANILGWNGPDSPARFAALAYELADAMMLARAAPPTPANAAPPETFSS